MTAETARQFEALERQAARLMAVFTRAGCEAVAPAVIQPADVFLDVIGEDLRARTYVFSDPDGHELCLRPDLTVPTCRLYLARQPSAGSAARFCYNGPAFRYQPAGADAAHPNEFRQAGIELFSAPDAEAAEVEVLSLVLAAIRDAGLELPTVRLGDLGLFHALLGDLAMPARWRARLRAQFWRPEAFRAALARLSVSPAGSLKSLPAGLAGRLDAGNRAASEVGVAAYMEENGIELIGARSLAEITDCLLAGAEDARAQPIPDRSRRLIENYLKIKGPLPAVFEALEKLLSGAGPRTERVMTAFAKRVRLMKGAGLDPATMQFSAEFGRSLEYYTGFVFEIVSPKLGELSPIAGGGRYDDLMTAVGAPRPVPAVGSAIHTERLLAAVNGSAP
jgi:ATP phosphoribosyltransferase regulatory subunit